MGASPWLKAKTSIFLLTPVYQKTKTSSAVVRQLDISQDLIVIFKCYYFSFDIHICSYGEYFSAVALAVEGLTVDEISVVVGTHGHSDHIGNLSLFPDSLIIVGFDISKGDLYLKNNLKLVRIYPSTLCLLEHLFKAYYIHIFETAGGRFGSNRM